MIGIATPFWVTNYGSKLQAYAIQTIIKDIVATEEAQIIHLGNACNHRFDVTLKKLCSVGHIIAYVKKKRSDRVLKKKVGIDNLKKRTKALHGFDDHFELSPKMDSYKLLKEYANNNYRAVVCGSDQIWIPDCLIGKYYTLDFYSKKNKIAYAASFGLASLPANKKAKYHNFLSKFIAISVRENTGVRIVNQLLNTDHTQLVCDPTFLLRKNEWNKIAEQSSISIGNERYILCYFLGSNPKHRAYVKEIAKHTGYKIKAFVHFKGWVTADENFADDELYDVTPCDFIRLIQKAELVCTDSMHATIFSMIFRTSFYTFERYANNDPDSRNTRIYSLLERTGFEKRLMQEKSLKVIELSSKREITDEEWEYAEKEMEKFRKKSMDFLRGALLNHDSNQR